MERRVWRELARCGEEDPEIFFAVDGVSTRTAVETCRRCPVRVECCEWAIAHDEPFGIWGGLSAVERQRLASRRRLAVLNRWATRHDWTTPSALASPLPSVLSSSLADGNPAQRADVAS